MRKKDLPTMNLDDVAQKAGVSTSTASRVLNNLKIVKTSTRSRVLRAAEELNCHPNLHARSLARGKSRILGIIVSNMENPVFFFDIYRTLESDARAQGFGAHPARGTHLQRIDSRRYARRRRRRVAFDRSAFLTSGS